jgi:hypothetical protein
VTVITDTELESGQNNDHGYHPQGLPVQPIIDHGNAFMFTEKLIGLFFYPQM